MILLSRTAVVDYTGGGAVSSEAAAEFSVFPRPGLKAGTRRAFVSYYVRFGDNNHVRRSEWKAISAIPR